MNRLWLISTGCFVCGLLLGLILKPDGPDEDQGSQDPSSRAPVRATKSGQRSGGSRINSWRALRDDIRAGNSEQMPQLLYRALEVADPVERRALILESFRGMDGSNWREMMDQFEKMTRKTGRSHEEEWRLAQMKIGQVAGRDAVEWWLEQRGTGAPLEQVVRGWAMTNPGEAVMWLDELEEQDPALRRKVLPLVIAGAALSDGVAAVPLLRQLPVEERTACIGHFAWNLVQSGGLDAAVEWAVQTRRTARPGEEAYAERVGNEVFGKVISAAKGRNGGRALAGHLTRLHEGFPIDEGHLGRAVTGLPGTEGLDLLAGLVGSPVIEGGVESSPMLRLAVQRAKQAGPEAVEKWLEQNSSVPFAETVREMVGRR